MKKTLNTPSGTVRVLLTHDNKAFRSGLRAFLESHENIEVVGEADNGALATGLAKLLKPDLILIDISLPGIAGPEAFRAMKRASPQSKIVLVNVHDEEGYRDLARQMEMNRFESKRLLKGNRPGMLERFRRIKDRASSRERQSSTIHHHA